MEGLLYGSALVGSLLIFVGIYLLAKRIRGHRTEVKIAGFGTIKTAHHGTALIFLGLALFLQSLTSFQQRDELKRNLEQLKNSQAALVSFLTPSVLSDAALRNYFKAAPANQQEAVLRRAIEMLRPEFRRVTDVKQSEFEEKDFSNVVSIYNFLIEIDPNDGSALYYKGEVQRLLRRRYLMRENFHLYLTHAPAPGIAQPGLRALGYFDERTGWIHHLLANDFLCEALQTVDPIGRSDVLRLVGNHVRKVKDYRRQGFIAGETTLSTETLERTTREGLDRIPKPKCPKMS